MIRHAWALLAFLPTTLWADSIQTFAQAMTAQQMIASGRESFVNRCSGCHGMEADGKGPAAPMLKVKPRNLVEGLFKFRSTAPGVLPTVEDLLRTIDRGVPGTSMPPFRELGEPEKLALVAYIRSLRPEFEATKRDQVSMAFPAPPEDIFRTKTGLLAAASKGRKHYEKSCLMCHGDQGRGDGPSAEGMTDNDDNPIVPANLQGKILKVGSTPRDVFRATTLGLEGAPMPAYLSNFSDRERWELVAYVFYLRGRGTGIYTEEDRLP